MRKELLLSIVLAIGIVGTALWVADRSLNANLAKNVEQFKEDRYAESDSGKTDIAKPSGSIGINELPSAPAANREIAATNGISKCIIAGKTVYSDTGCPNGAKHLAVALQDSAGIISPPKESLAELSEKREATERAYALQAQPQVVAIGHSRRVECEELDRRIADLDSMARQPHSGLMQDWIKNERKLVRDRKFTIRC